MSTANANVGVREFFFNWAYHSHITFLISDTNHKQWARHGILLYTFIGLQESRRITGVSKSTLKSVSMDVVDDSHHFQVTNLSINKMNPVVQPSSSKVKLPHSPVLPTHLDRGPVPVKPTQNSSKFQGPAFFWWISAKLENKHMKQRGKTHITNIHQARFCSNKSRGVHHRLFQAAWETDIFHGKFGGPAGWPSRKRRKTNCTSSNKGS